MKTMICLILDRSGSMSGHEGDVIGGINTLLNDQKKLPDPASVAFVRFDSQAIERFRPMTPLAQVEPLTDAEYTPRASTPLLDAVGQTIIELEADWRQQRPDRAVVVIVTDGLENSSREFTKQQVCSLIKARQDSGKWAFIYLGADVDAFAEAGGLGIARSNTAGYVKTSAGVRHMYHRVSRSVEHVRSTGEVLVKNLGYNLRESDAEDEVAAQALEPSAPASPTTEGATHTPVWTPPA
jgi:uncharacterized protein YegL